MKFLMSSFMLLIFASRHHMNESILKSVFERKIHQVTGSFEFLNIKNVNDNRKKIDSHNILMRRKLYIYIYW